MIWRRNMKHNTLMIINAVVAAVFGVAFVLVPGQVTSLYGVEDPSEVLIYVGRLMGAAFIGFAVLTWSARNANDSSARRAIVFALLVSDGVGFIVSLMGQLADVVNSLGWSTVAIYLLLALGFGYFQFVRQEP
jgi:uncharacterized membrane protein YcfT